MKISKLNAVALVLVSFLALLANSAIAADYDNMDSKGASIKILSPSNKAQIDAGEEYALKYEVTPGAGGDHFHVWVDDTRGPGIHDTKGTYMLPKMAPGNHTITIKVVDKGHIPTGPQQSITVTAK
jgi:hypothetical protein